MFGILGALILALCGIRGRESLRRRTGDCARGELVSRRSNMLAVEPDSRALAEKLNNILFNQEYLRSGPETDSNTRRTGGLGCKSGSMVRMPKRVQKLKFLLDCGLPEKGIL